MLEQNAWPLSEGEFKLVVAALVIVTLQLAAAADASEPDRCRLALSAEILEQDASLFAEVGLALVAAALLIVTLQLASAAGASKPTLAGSALAVATSAPDPRGKQSDHRQHLHEARFLSFA